MNELALVFGGPLLVAAGMAGWALKGYMDGRNTKAALLKKAEDVISQLEDLAKQNSNAQAAADAATLSGLQDRFKAL